MSKELCWLFNSAVTIKFTAEKLTNCLYLQTMIKQQSLYSKSVCKSSMSSAHQRFHDDALYKSTFYLLTYLLQPLFECV